MRAPKRQFGGANPQVEHRRTGDRRPRGEPDPSPKGVHARVLTTAESRGGQSRPEIQRKPLPVIRLCVKKRRRHRNMARLFPIGRRSRGCWDGAAGNARRGLRDVARTGKLGRRISDGGTTKRRWGQAGKGQRPRTVLRTKARNLRAVRKTRIIPDPACGARADPRHLETSRKNPAAQSGSCPKRGRHSESRNEPLVGRGIRP